MKTMLLCLLKPERMGIGGSRWYIQVKDTIHITNLKGCRTVMDSYGKCGVDYEVVQITPEAAQVSLAYEANLKV
jgi:hypothetical protein